MWDWLQRQVSTAGRSAFVVGTRVLDRYEVVEVVVGTPRVMLFRGRDLYTHDDVAIKARPTGQQGASTGFHGLRHQALMVTLAHPGIVPVWACERARGWIVEVMPFMAGGSWSRLLEADGAQDAALACAIGAAALDGLGHAHAAGIVHGALKPTSVLFDGFGRVGLTGFRGADVLVAGPSRRYLPPECSPPRHPTPRDDVYATAALVHEAVGAGLPFQGESEGAVVALDHGARPPRSAPDALRAVLERALARRPRARFEDAGALRAALLTVPGAASAYAHLRPGAGGCDPTNVRTYVRLSEAGEASAWPAPLAPAEGSPPAPVADPSSEPLPEAVLDVLLRVDGGGETA